MINFFFSFFFSQILEVGPKEGLARFGYRLERKVEKLTNSTVHDGYMLKPIVYIWLTWAPFFPKENPFLLFTIPPPSKVLSSMMQNFTQKK